tara:strand:+ start:1337 stop:2029 length:693 start_codon:yes stop_codon:yes gene_type:complete
MRIVTNSADLRRQLGGRHDVYVVDNEEILEWHDPDEFRLIIIDIDASEGVYSPRVLRQENSEIPIIGISENLPSGADWTEQRATFIEQGGSYLLQAPINPREMLACISELNRRSKATRPTKFLFGRRLVINTSERFAMFDGRLLNLTGKENFLFMELADHFGAVRTKENLMSAIYRLNEDEAEIKIIDVFVCKIRKKLDRLHPGLGKCIQTIWGQGYKLEDVFVEDAEVA